MHMQVKLLLLTKLIKNRGDGKACYGPYVLRLCNFNKFADPNDDRGLLLLTWINFNPSKDK